MKVIIAFCSVAVLLTIVNGKIWKEARNCFEEELESCYNKCKDKGNGLLQIFNADKFVGCLKNHKEEIVGKLKECLKEEDNIDFAELESKPCWKPVNETDWFNVENKMSKFARRFPSAKELVDCAKTCLKQLKETCFKDCTAEEDEGVKQAFKACMPKTRDAARPIMKRCMKPGAN